jgi:hypothetical protein
VALKQCKECHKDLAKSVKKCIHCGADQRSWAGRHPILTVIGVLFGIGIIGNIVNPNHSSTTTSNNTQAENRPAAVAETEKTYKIGEQVNVGSFAYMVNKKAFYKTLGNQFYKKTADGTYLLVDMAIVNGDKESHTLDSSMFKVIDSKGNSYDASVEANTALSMSSKETLFLKACQPNIQITGLIPFEVPNQTDKYTIKLSGGFWSGKTANVSLQ